jgi:hypothetical protein
MAVTFRGVSDSISQNSAVAYTLPARDITECCVLDE